MLEVPKYKPIQFKIEHPDNTGSLSLLDFKSALPLSLHNPNQHFQSVPKQITLEMKLNEFTIYAEKRKTKLHTPHIL